MKNSSFIQKVLLLTVVPLIFVSLSAFADSTAIEQRVLSHNSLLSSGISELSIDHSHLFADASAAAAQQQQYALSSGSGKTQSSAATQKKNRAALETWHKYLGYGTVLMAGMTAATSSDEDLHKSFAYVTATGALSTVLTGYLAHSDRFDSYEGLLSKDNLHIMLGVLGAAILTTAVAIADDGENSSHSGLGVTGGVLMTLGVIDIKW